MIKLSYKGRTFTSAKSLSDAIQRDIQGEYERKVRSAATSAGLSVRRTSNGLEVTGEAQRMERFYDRLSK